MTRKNLRRITPPPPFERLQISIGGRASTRQVCSNQWARFMMDRMDRQERLAMWLPLRIDLWTEGLPS
jgi:hypothetical protein